MNKFLLAVVLLGALLRLIWLGQYPPGFTPDEAAFGYNAYSILQTGKDEWGTPWWKLPLTNLRSFGDYKLPLYVYLTVPSLKLFGLNEFATRLPNAVLGVLAIVIIYLLTNKLFPGRGLITAALLALSPWHIQLSRGAFEANLITFFLPLGIYLFLSRRYLFSAVVMSLGMYSYHSARLLIPTTLIILALFIRPQFRKVTPALVIFLLLSLPAFLTSFSSRVGDVGIFNPTDKWQAVADRRFIARNLEMPDFFARIFSNKATYVLSTSVKNYISYLSPDFLFASGAGESTYGMIPGRGVMYYIELPLLVSFFVLLIKKPSKSLLLLFLLFVLTPLPAALSKGPGSAANRAASMIPFLVIMSAVGLVYLIESFKKYSKCILVTIYIFYFIFSIFFFEDYVYHSPSILASSMSYGWKQLFTRLNPIAQRFSDVRFSRTLSEPHIFVAFYNQIPPRDYQSASKNWADFQDKGFKFLDQYDGYYLGKYRFGDIHPKDKVDHPILFVGKPTDFPPDFSQYFHIDYPNGQPAIQVSEKLP